MYIFSCLLKIGMRGYLPWEFVYDHKATTEKTLVGVPTKQNSLIDEAVKRASPSDLSSWAGSYRRRWSFRFSGPKPWRALKEKNNSLNWA